MDYVQLEISKLYMGDSGPILVRKNPMFQQLVCAYIFSLWHNDAVAQYSSYLGKDIFQDYLFL